ncbi:hypothetical protein Csac_1386 [Caldicellulosiruptor saccharolyticus DSM 8903]|uniref:Transmembrane protein n=1 Tax=Caldicellulosiruptor saccharolyticus (strain ATCC 43494 / DSM 8903 / Tp8T 6331) TaxID=351627 RepID=A4XJA3_CALS8|nr:hypothetical protein [Caldicellulosiruptor saccharolyticus]ABP66988.1 hypothetical protein Csac_1386 [Caldicellulosiruptor saccharolyticus DSM 8903]
MEKLKTFLPAVLLLAFTPVFVFAEDTTAVKTIKLAFNVVLAIGFLSLFVSITLFFIRLMVHKDSRERAKIMQWSKYILAGSIIIFALSTVVGIMLSYQQQLIDIAKINFTNTANEPTLKKILFDIGDKIDIFVNAIINVLSAFIVTPIEWFAKLAGFKPMNQLFFEGNPFSDKEMDFILKFYWIVASVSSVFIIILAGKTAIKLMFSGITASERVSLTKEVTTWFMALLVIATAPWILYLMYEFFSLLTMWLQSAINSGFSYTTNSNKTFVTILHAFGLGYDQSESSIKNYKEILQILGEKNPEEIIQKQGIIDTFFFHVCGSNPANTIIMKALYLPLWAKINIVFMVRKYILGIFFLFTPVAVLMWGIKRDSMLLDVWFGETLTNVSMAFFYAFTYMATVHIFTAAGWTGWVFGFIAMYSIPKVADTLRNLLQNMFERWAGIDELNLARPALGSLSNMLMGFRNAFSALSMIRPTRLAESANIEESASTIAPMQNRAVVVKGSRNYDDDENLFTGGMTTPPPYFGPTPRPSFGPRPGSGGGGAAVNTKKAAVAFALAGATGGASILAASSTTSTTAANAASAQGTTSFASFGTSTGKGFSATDFEILKESSGTYKIDDRIDSVVFEKMKHNPEYQQYFQTGGLQNMLTNINKTKMFVEAIKTGDTTKLEKEHGISDNTKHALSALHHIYKVERDLLLSQLGIHEVKTPNQKRYFVKPDFSEFRT